MRVNGTSCTANGVRASCAPDADARSGPARQSLELADDNRFHLPHGADGYDCLIRHGQRWRQAARNALGLAPKPTDARDPNPSPSSRSRKTAIRRGSHRISTRI